jgi:hypothetical protein
VLDKDGPRIDKLLITKKWVEFKSGN